MATFRSGFKILGELSLRQSIGRIRSFSEDRKWSPEDQWAVRPPCSTCPNDSCTCAPKKPVKPSRSWLSICKDEETEDTSCDYRHNNCPPPRPKNEPWYSFITKKKPPQKMYPLNACRIAQQKLAEESLDPYNDPDEYYWPCDTPCNAREPPPVCPERSPAPVVRLSCPPPKDLDLMLWCGKPAVSVTRIAAQCHSDRMPYEEFRPRKTWKPPPFSLPCKNEAPVQQPFCCNIGRAPLSEYKQVDIPKPLYTRYKSVELEDENFLLCMTDAKCTEEPDLKKPSLAMQSPPLQKPRLPPRMPKTECLEKPVIVAASRKPVKLKCAPKFKFQPKPTKLIEKKNYWNPCAQHSTCNLSDTNPPKPMKGTAYELNNQDICAGDYTEPPKVITGTLTDEPQMFERNLGNSRKPPSWMYMLSKPGSKDTPLVPHLDTYPKEPPDWCSETDGLKFYDGQDEGINPRPPPDPCKSVVANSPQPVPQVKMCSAPPVPMAEETPETDKFVLMPQEYGIRYSRMLEEERKSDLKDATFQEFIDAKSSNIKKCSKLYPQMKENILYDLVRNCPLPPIDPTKVDPLPRKPPPPECSGQSFRHCNRKYSTFTPFHLRKPNYTKVLNRMKSEDFTSKCKARKMVPKPKDCALDEKIGPTCNEMEMPCCPKARIPPKCDVKKVLPPCKKKLAPKPAYSECIRDPPPCPKNTECNCWEKVDMENSRKGPPKSRRGFSSWAPEQERALEEKCDAKPAGEHNTQALDSAAETHTASGPSYSEYLDIKNNGQSLNKNKWSSHKQRKVFSGKELMLNFVNPTEEANSYYISDSLVRRRKPQWRKLKSDPQPKSEKKDTSDGNHELHERKVITALLQDHHTRNDIRLKSLSAYNRDATPAAYNSENTTKGSAGAIGSWINGIIKAQKKRSHSSPPPIGKNGRHPVINYVESVDVDRLMKLTKPFRNKFKSRSYENLVYYPKDNTSSAKYQQKKIPSPFKRLWGRNRNRALFVFPQLKRQPAQSSMWKYESLSPPVSHFRQKNKHSEKLNSAKAKRSSVGDQKSTLNLRKDFPRMDARKSKSPIHTVESLSGKSFLLNFDNPSPPVRLFAKGNSVRTYMAIARDEDKSKPEKQFGINVKKIRSKYSISYRTISSLIGSRNLTLPYNSTKSASSHAVQFIPRNMKDRSKKNNDDMEASRSAKFMQSATSSLVASAIARKDSHNMKIVRGNCDSRFVPCASIDKALMALASPQKPWIYTDKMPDHKPEKKPITHGTIMRNKSKKWENEGYSSEPSRTKRIADEYLKSDLKYCADKHTKRKEVRDMLTKLELKKRVLQVADNTTKTRQKEHNRKEMLSMLDSHADNFSGRFEWQHALFRNNTKQVQKSVVEIAEDPPEPADLTEIRSLMGVPDSSNVKPLNVSISDTCVAKKVNNNVELYDGDIEDVGYVMEDKPSTLRLDSLKSERVKEQLDKMKWARMQRDKDRLIGNLACEKSAALTLDKREVRPMTTAVSRHDKTTNSQNTKKRTIKRNAADYGKQSDPCGDGKEKKNDCDKPTDGCGKATPENGNKNTQSPCNKKKNEVKKKENTDVDESGCPHDKIRKPGPNCPEG